MTPLKQIWFDIHSCKGFCKRLWFLVATDTTMSEQQDVQRLPSDGLCPKCNLNLTKKGITYFLKHIASCTGGGAMGSLVPLPSPALGCHKWESALPLPIPALLLPAPRPQVPRPGQQGPLFRGRRTTSTNESGSGEIGDFPFSQDPDEFFQNCPPLPQEITVGGGGCWCCQ